MSCLQGPALVPAAAPRLELGLSPKPTSWGGGSHFAALSRLWQGVGLSQKPMEGKGDSVSALPGLKCGFFIIVENIVLSPGWRGRDPSSVRFTSVVCSKWNTIWWFSTLADIQCYLGSFENTHSQRLFTVTYPAYSTVPGTQDMHYVKLVKCMGNTFCLSRLSRKVRRYSLLANHLYTHNPE